MTATTEDTPVDGTSPDPVKFRARAPLSRRTLGTKGRVVARTVVNETTPGVVSFVASVAAASVAFVRAPDYRVLAATSAALLVVATVVSWWWWRELHPRFGRWTTVALLSTVWAAAAAAITAAELITATGPFSMTFDNLVLSTVGTAALIGILLPVAAAATLLPGAALARTCAPGVRWVWRRRFTFWPVRR